MKHPFLPLLSSAALPLLAFTPLVRPHLPRSETAISFAPAEGQTVVRKFTGGAQLALDDMQITINGQPSPMPMEMEMDMDMTTEFEVTDKFVSLASGRPLELLRTYDELALSGSFAIEMEMMPGGGQETDMTATSELEGKSVAFTWDEDSEEYDAAWHESEGDDELLENLSEDMDLRVLLPPTSVEEGATWDIDVAKLTDVLALGGDMGLEPEIEDEAQSLPGMGGMGGGMGDMLGESIEGTATGEFKGLQELDGVHVAAIAVKIDVEGSNDMTEQVNEQMEKMGDQVGEMSVEYADVELDLQAEGTLYWNMDTHHAHSFELGGTMHMVMDTAMKVSQGGQELRIEQMLEMSGTFDNELTVRAQ
jgi:hypothetical protein